MASASSWSSTPPACKGSGGCSTNCSAAVDFQTWTGPDFSPAPIVNLDFLPLAGDDDQRPVAGVRIAEGHVAATPGLAVELTAGLSI